MATLMLSHPDCAGHVTPGGHPEQVARIKYVEAALATPDFDALIRAEAPLATDDQIARAHPQRYIDRIRAAEPGPGEVRSLDADTHMTHGSLNAALRGAGALVAAVDAVIGGQAGNAFAAVRPPGHHAESETPMGFCFFGNVVIGALHALDFHGLDRVAIVDFDVHHGNGTQDLVWDDPRIFFASTHQSPLYPGTGGTHETGGSGNVLNVPLAPNTGSAAFRSAMEGQVLPAVAAFDPQLIIISAGFDAHADDPLANLMLTEADFAWATGRLCDIADQTAQGRVVSSLEGGYDLDALAASTAAHVKTLMERSG